MENKTKRPGLIRQERVVPKNQESAEKNLKDEVITERNQKKEDHTTKKLNINQQRNIKISVDTKKQLDILLKFSNHKFAYELIDSMIDVYVEHALDNDQKRAFKTLSKIISE